MTFQAGHAGALDSTHSLRLAFDSVWADAGQKDDSPQSVGPQAAKAPMQTHGQNIVEHSLVSGVSGA